MAHEVCPGQSLRHSGVLYPSGSLVPAGADIQILESLGVVRPVGSVEAPPRPKPKAVAPVQKADPGPGPVFDAGDPASVIAVPLRLLPDILADIDDESLLRKMHEADTRKGGRDRIEERMGELGVSDG